MKEKKFNTLTDFRGKLNQQNDPKSEAFVRAQYLKAIAGVE